MSAASSRCSALSCRTAAQHSLSYRGITPCFSEIATDHIAALADPRVLGLDLGVGMPGSRDDDRNARLGALQHRLDLGQAFADTK